MAENTADNPEETLSRIRTNAELAVRLSQKLCGFEFGFDQRSVEWLDGFIERLRSKPRSDEDDEKYVSIFGSYLGEAIVHSYGGSWAINESGWHIRFDDRNLVFPFSKVKKQLSSGEEDSISSFYDAIPIIFGTAILETTSISQQGTAQAPNRRARAILTDAHFLVPLIAFFIGLTLLIALH
jgi:hypothetical protein